MIVLTPRSVTTFTPGGSLTVTGRQARLLLSGGITDQQLDQALALVPAEAVLVGTDYVGDSDLWMFQW